MIVTEVRIKLMPANNERLLAFASVTFDGVFAVRDVKIIDGDKGYFVAMPSRKTTDRCPQCGFKNHLRANYCNHCGTELDEDRQPDAKLYHDLCHPVCTEFRQLVTDCVLDHYREELRRSKLPGYQCRYFGEAP